MKFSIVVVCLNAGEELSKTVESVLNQSYGDFEIIIKDGLSQDGSVQKLPRDSRIRVMAARDQGIYDAMNQALQNTMGEYIYFLNCGDYLYERDTLAKVAGAIKEHPGRNVYYGNTYERLSKSKVSANPRIDDFACYRNIPCHQACFYQRELIINHPFETKYRVRADYEQFLWCHKKAHASMYYMNTVVCSYQGGGYSETEKGLAISAAEHKEITKQYFTPLQLWGYKMIMILTLAKLRTAISKNPKTAAIYHGAKKIIYLVRR